MLDLKGRKFAISGMTIEVIADLGDRWETRNITTHETVLMDKQVLEKAVRLGHAEEVF